MDTTPKLSGSRRYPKQFLSTNLIHLKRFICLLANKPYSRKELEEETGMAPGTVVRYIQVLHQGPDNLIFISAYQMSKHKRWREQFSLGFRQPDVPSPEPNRVRRPRKHATEITPAPAPAKNAGSIVKTPTGIIHVLR